MCGSKVVVERKCRQFTGLSLKLLNNSRVIISRGTLVQREQLPTKPDDSFNCDERETSHITSRSRNLLKASSARVSSLSEPQSVTVSVEHDSPLIHLASGSWTLNSGLNKSSTVSLVSLPSWLSTEKNKPQIVQVKYEPQ